jgi:hypothetical protein
VLRRAELDDASFGVMSRRSAKLRRRTNVNGVGRLAFVKSFIETLPENVWEIV